jgi:hypothetical protein
MSTTYTDELCRQCEGNGVVKIPGGISVCPRCEGRSYEPAAPTEREPQKVPHVEVPEHHGLAAERFKTHFTPVLYEATEKDSLERRMLVKIYNIAATAKHRGDGVTANELRAIHSAAFAGVEGPDPDYALGEPADAARNKETGLCCDCRNLRPFELTDELFTCPVVNIRIHADSAKIFGCNQFAAKATYATDEQAHEAAKRVMSERRSMLERLADAAGTPRAPHGWQPIETCPRDQEVFFWLVPKTAEESYADTSGWPIVSHHAPYWRRGRWQSWGALSKPTHWMPLPDPPAGDAAGTVRDMGEPTEYGDRICEWCNQQVPRRHRCFAGDAAGTEPPK